MKGNKKMSNVLERNHYYSIDALKVIASLLVICIHTNPFYYINPSLALIIKDIIARTAVPFFFITSGYFFSLKLEKTDNAKKALLHRIYWLMRIYLLWSLIYWVYEFINIFSNGSTFRINLKTILLFFRDFFILGNFIHLWFLPSLIISTIFIALYHKFMFHKRKVLILIILLLYIVGAMGDCYYVFFQNNKFIKLLLLLFGNTRNGIFFGIPLFSMGYIISFINAEKIRKYCSYMLLLSLVLLFYEGIKINQLSQVGGRNLYISLIPVSGFLLLFCINKPNFMKRYFFTKWSKYSLGIYLSHFLFKILYDKYLPLISSNKVLFDLVNTPLIFISALIITIYLYNIKINFLNYFVKEGKTFDKKTQVSNVIN